MRNIMKKSIIFLGAFLFLSGWVIKNNVLAYSPIELYDNVWNLINNKYLDRTFNSQDWTKWRHKYDTRIKTNEDAYVAINTMLASLDDPYTKFLDPKEFAEETNSINGSLKGIGIQIGERDGKLMVIAPLEGTPAEKAGLLADDEILEIDGTSTKGLSINKAVDKIRGKEGTSVCLLIKRKDNPPKLYTITRAEINVKSVSQKAPMDSVVPKEYCYIRLSSFISRNAADEFGQIVHNNRYKKGFIIDLRSNPGGLLSNAIYISDMFLDGGTIVSTIDRNGYPKHERALLGSYTKSPVVILINKGSASASEIFSGAMQDHHRAVLVGDKSFGKGLVQEINKLPYESGVNITIQKYLTPNGTDINKKGITPDIEVELTDKDLEENNDLQLKKAIEVLDKMTNRVVKQ